MDRKELEVGSHSKPTPRKSTQHRKEVRDPHAHVKPVYIEYVIKLLINRATRVDATPGALRICRTVSKNTPATICHVSNIFNRELLAPFCFFEMETLEG